MATLTVGHNHLRDYHYSDLQATTHKELSSAWRHIKRSHTIRKVLHDFSNELLDKFQIPTVGEHSHAQATIADYLVYLELKI